MFNILAQYISTTRSAIDKSTLKPNLAPQIGLETPLVAFLIVVGWYCLISHRARSPLLPSKVLLTAPLLLIWVLPAAVSPLPAPVDQRFPLAGGIVHSPLCI